MAAIIMCLAAPLALAKNAPVHDGVAIITGQEIVEPSFLQDGMRISAVTGVPLAIYGPNYLVEPADPETMARQYLSDHRALLGLRDAELADLDVRHARTSQVGATVRFDQVLEGVPVYRSEIAVTIDQQNRVIFVANSYKPAASVSGVVPAITAESARQTAFAHLGVEGDLHHEQIRLVVYPSGGEYRLAFQVKLAPSVSPIGDWEIMVDALTGEILKAVDAACYLDGNGNIFDPDPLSSAGATYGDPGFVDGNDANTPELIGEQVNAVLRDIDFDGSVYTLKGPYAEIRDFESPFYGLFTEPTSTWMYNRQDNAFEAALTYWHVDNIMRYLNEGILVNVMPYQYSGGVRFDPHGLSGADNSHYITSSGSMAFGEGGVDDSEDADVVIHELGHGLHDWITNGSLSQVDGLSEGTGDYMAQSYSRSLNQWLPSQPAYQWVFSWDGHNPFWPGRVTNYGATYPGGLTGAIHTDGQIWSTCLMRIWDAIGREQTDRACWEGLAMTGGSSGQNDAANAMLQAAIAMGYSQAEISAMVSNFQQTGYSVGTPAEIDVAPLSFDFTLAPNTQETQVLTIQNLTDPLFGAALDWTVADLENFARSGVRVVASRNAMPALELAKGEESRYQGPPVTSDLGGPDGFGYVWIDSDDPGGPTFAWNDISGVGTSISLTDDGSQLVTLPFSFPFYGQDKTFMRISANGYLTFGSSGGVYTNTGIPVASAPNDLIAPFWDDLNPSLGGTIHYYHDAGAGEFIVQYTNIQHFGGSAPYTFQVILRANGEILCQYRLMQGGLDSATVGIENADASTGLEVVYNAPYVHDNLAILFRRLADCPWLSENPTSGNLPPQGSQNVDVIADATGLFPGTYTCNLIVSSNDPDESSISIPVTLVVTGSTGVGAEAQAPREFRLYGNTPNPFNPFTTIRYELPVRETVRLAVYDMGGRLVRILVDGAEQDAGEHATSWDGRDADGHGVASGVYFYRIDAGTFSETRRAVLLR